MSKQARIVVQFDAFARSCPYFDDKTEVNNGYGCAHPQCEDADFDEERGCEIGKCSIHNCPLCSPLGEDDLTDPEIDMDGADIGDVVDGEGHICGDYGTVDCSGAASETEEKALSAYMRYMHRYDREWLKKHDKPGCPSKEEVAGDE